jgi:hypothetical protein
VAARPAQLLSHGDRVNARVYTAADLFPMKGRELRAILEQGHPIDPTRLDDTEYNGVALDMPGFMEKVLWKTFKKVFYRDPDTGVLRGWNVAVEQNGVEGPFVDRLKKGKRITYWFYEVHGPDNYHPPKNQDRGLIIDYGPQSSPFTITHFVRDPLVAVNEGDDRLLLGYSYAALGSIPVPVPSWFLLMRGDRLTYRDDP